MPSSSSSSSSHLLSFLSILSLLSFISTSPIPSPTTISIPLTHFTKTPSLSPTQKLTHLAFQSLTRAKHLKNPQKSHLSSTPLSPRSYGGYSVSLKFGTPPQTIPFIMDTGSDLVWFPCTHNYQCKNCSLANPTAKIPSFIPKLSSSSKLIGCKNPKCSWIHTSDVKSRCKDCNLSQNCTQICPPYLVIYGSGTTGGILLSETLDFTEKRFTNFAVGCSLFSSRSPSGIAGFGRGPSSLPSQLRLSKFSYCLLSHRFDDTSATTSLILDSGVNNGDGKTNGVIYTPFVKNPVTGRPAFSVYYYVGLRKITVGGKGVKIPYSYLTQQGTDGNGGTIVDSGTTFTFMESRVFELLSREVLNQTAHYKRKTDVEARSGLRPCYDMSDVKNVLLPKMVLHFKGGAKMDLPVANYFSFIGESGVVCMTIVTDDGNVGGEGLTGPSVILGNYQMQNYYVEFDRKNERFGFRQQTCK